MGNLTRVLFVNNGLHACGVNQYGRSAYAILSQDGRYEWSYAECWDAPSYLLAYHEIKPGIVLWNYQEFNSTFAVSSLLDSTPALHVAIAHLEEPGRPETINYSQFHRVLSQDPSSPGLGARVRPITRPVGPILPPSGPPKRLTIGSFGFVYQGKGIENVIRAACAEFEDCLIRLHMPTGSLDPAGSQRAKDTMIERCRAIIQSNGKRIDLELSLGFLPREDLIRWLNGNSINVFWYDSVGNKGVSSCIDAALEANRPVAVSNCPMFRHVHALTPDVNAEKRSLADILADGDRHIRVMQREWSPVVFRASVLRALEGPPPLPVAPSNRVLTRAAEWESAAEMLRQSALHVPSCPIKSWDLLIALSHLKPGPILDLGSFSSQVLPNAVRLGHRGAKYGIDKTYEASDPGFTKLRGDFFETRFPDGSFDNIVSLSVLEHLPPTGYPQFAKLCSRLLRDGGIATISFDYWPDGGDGVYRDGWNILSRDDAKLFVSMMEHWGLHPTSDIDWTAGEKTIHPDNWSPGPFGYTFACLAFEKRNAD